MMKPAEITNATPSRWATESRFFDREELLSRPDNASYDRHEAAIFLGVSYHTLKAWSYKNKGPVFHMLGRKPIYLRRDLDAFRDRGRRGSAQ